MGPDGIGADHLRSEANVPKRRRFQALVHGAGRSWAVAIACTLGFRLIYSAFATLFLYTATIDPAMVKVNMMTEGLLVPSDGLRYWILGPWQRFDALWYVHIAQNGYAHPASVVFYPLYPLLIRVTSLITQDPLLAGITVSTISVLWFFKGLYVLGEMSYPPQHCLRAVLLAGVWPTSFVFFGAYTEPLLLALIVWSVYWGRMGRWRVATILGLLAALTKVIGITVFIPLAIFALRTENKRNAWPILALPMVPLLVGAGLLLSGRQPPHVAYELYWFTSVSSPWVSLSKAIGLAVERGFTHPLPIHLIVFGVTIALCCTRALMIEYVAFVLSAAMVIASKDAPLHQQQWGRYVLPLFPAYLAAARFEAVFPAAVVSSFFLNLALLRAYVEWSGVV